MKYAIIQDGSRQYKVEEGLELLVEHRKEAGKTISFENVLLLVDEGKVKVGTPNIKGAEVVADVIGDHKGLKLEVIKYKAKSRYRKHTGHRHLFTRIKISKITS